MKHVRSVRRSLGGIALAMACAIGPWPGNTSSAHDVYGEWLRNDGKGSCCNNHDCAPAVAERRGGSWYVKRHGGWLRVPDDAVLRKASPDGQAHACILGGAVVCFVEPILA